MFRSKNYKESTKLFDKQTLYVPEEAFDLHFPLLSFEDILPL